MRGTLFTIVLLLAGAGTATGQIRPDSGVPVASGTAMGPTAGTAPRMTQPATGCLEPRAGSYALPAIEFDGRRFEPSGSPEPIQAENLDLLGEHGGVPLFAGRLALRPVVDLWVPVCAQSDHYQLYTHSTARAGPSGS